MGHACATGQTEHEFTRGEVPERPNGAVLKTAHLT